VFAASGRSQSSWCPWNKRDADASAAVLGARGSSNRPGYHEPPWHLLRWLPRTDSGQYLASVKRTPTELNPTALNFPGHRVKREGSGPDCAPLLPNECLGPSREEDAVVFSPALVPS
jgi:hypothetical protein